MFYINWYCFIAVTVEHFRSRINHCWLPLMHYIWSLIWTFSSLSPYSFCSGPCSGHCLIGLMMRCSVRFRHHHFQAFVWPCMQNRWYLYSYISFLMVTKLSCGHLWTNLRPASSQVQFFHWVPFCFLPSNKGFERFE